MQKLVAAFCVTLLCLIGIAGCATSSQAAGHPSSLPEPTLGAVDLSRYNVPPEPNLTAPLHISTMTLDPSTPARMAVVRTGVRYQSPFDGICLNTEAEAAIEASFNAQIRTAQNDQHQSVAELAASASRDLLIAQSNAGILRAFYQAQVADREISLNQANQTNTALQRATTGTFWQIVGWTGAGAVVGAVIAGVAILIH